MKTVLRVFNAGQWQNFSALDLPLAISGSSNKEIIFGNQVGAKPEACFELINHKVFLRSEEGADFIQLNGKKLNVSKQLSVDDKIQINNIKFSVKIESDIIILSPDALPKETVTTPQGPTAFAPLPGKNERPGLRNAIIIFFVLLLSSVVYVLAAVSVRVVVSPAPDHLSLSGFPPTIKIGESYLVLPGKYHVAATKEGYHNLQESIKVKRGSDSAHSYKLQKLPGLLDIVSAPAEGAQVAVDGRVIGITPLKSFELEAGRHELRVSASRYLANTQAVDIEGMGVKQLFEVTLEPDWGTLRVDSNPQDAQVWLNGQLAGQTPLKTEPVGGEYQMEIRKEGWQSIFDKVTIETGKIVNTPLFVLQKVDGTVELKSDPTDARVYLNGKFRGNTPITLIVMSEKEHELRLSKNGYITATQSLRVEPEKVRQVKIPLEPEYGIVFIMSKPADAKLIIDGQTIKGPASRRLRLTTLPHQIEIRKEGYQLFTTTVKPTVGLSKRVNAQLLSDRQVRLGAKQPIIKTPQGQVMRRIVITKPLQFQMGASRRESGRRSNEAQHRVELSRTFDISVMEVTNAEFQEYHRQHDSGSEGGFDLNEADQPVASVEWDQAALYLNWLSIKDGLPPAYEEKDGKVIAVIPVTTGYRLPTEAEWAFVARYQGEIVKGMSPLKYPWGSNRNPSENSGNYADSSASIILPVFIKGYNDGYEVAAPVGQFPANALGIYDLGGNVSEWCHDYYDVHVGGSQKVIRDPIGPAEGEHHVIRGASWRLGSITELRQTYRDYSNKFRNDLGFRIARYAE